MKEFLEPHPNGNYAFVKAESSLHPSWIEIPDGSECAVLGNDGNIYFWKSHCFIGGIHEEWVDMKFGHDAKWYLKSSSGSKIIWQRSETEYLMQGKNGERLMESAGQLKDNVNQPNHYTSGGIECLDAMQAMLSRDEFIGFLRGNVFKYNWRYKLKNGIEDLKKAQFYQNKLIELESGDAI